MTANSNSDISHIEDFEFGKYLSSLVDFETSKGANYTGKKPNLEPFKNFLSFLGNPQLSYRTIIIAGSKGKGTTGCYLEALLRQAGYQTGLYSSPHIENLFERIRINGSTISEQAFSSHLQLLAIASQEADYELSLFEALTACAFSVFEREEVDVGILEVGLGGRLDATNTAMPEIAIITKILHEHTSVLGDTLREIVREKGEVIRKGSHVFTTIQEDEVLVEIKKKCNLLDASFSIIGDEDIENLLHASGLPRVLRENLTLAIHAYKRFSSKKVPAGFVVPQLQGRYQRISYEDSEIIVDAAHNPVSVAALLEYSAKELGGFRVVFSVLSDKKYTDMLEQFANCNAINEIVFIRLEDSRAVSPELLCDYWKEISEKTCRIVGVSDLLLIVRQAEASLVTGSFRLLSAFFSKLGER